MLVALFKFESLPGEIKALNGIKSKSRLDCVSYAGHYEGLTNFVNQKGQLFFYKTPCREVVETHRKRYAEWLLSICNMNLSSIYIEDIDFLSFGYGYPNAKPILSNGMPNPFYPYRNDAYLFIVNKDYTQIDVLIVANGRNLINHYYQTLIDGGLDAYLHKLRSDYKPFYQYIGYGSSL